MLNTRIKTSSHSLRASSIVRYITVEAIPWGKIVNNIGDIGNRGPGRVGVMINGIQVWPLERRAL